LPESGRESIEVFFTNPALPDANRFRGGLDVQIAESIDAARLSVDVAIHELNLWTIRDALIDAHQRGVRVRVVAESDNFDYVEFGELKDAGIPVLGDRREGLMHNKFIVIDQQEVWTGSVNFTTTDMYLNNNNLLHILSAPLAENYTREFEEMFVADLFGDAVRADTPFPQLVIAGFPVENYFSPDDGIEQVIISRLKTAQSSIYFLAFSFTSDPIADALLDSTRRGVRVTGVMEESQVNSNTGTEYENLRLGGVDVRLDGNRRNMHHKVFIIDERIVIVGSYNFSASAERRNDENLLIIDDPELASRFLSEFQTIIDLSIP
jgi:phosphatidylserine/phosphatidylglycerophosphate/cardiolipin synthase-like enzyme